jgi:hypothetical protein
MEENLQFLGGTYFHWFNEFKEAGCILTFIVQTDHMLVSVSTWYQFKCPCQARKTQAVKRYNWYLRVQSYKKSGDLVTVCSLVYTNHDPESVV